jgi:NitT/TauT family transport system ATP-binding protein
MSTTAEHTQHPVPVTSGHIEVRNLTYRYPGARTPVIDGLDFTIEPGRFVCLVGPSGCGKTTLLRLLAGLLAPATGEVRIDRTTVTEPPPDLGFVFQDHTRALLPWRTAARNVEFGLEAAGVPRAERGQRVHEVLERVHLPDVEHLYPGQLSGGMQQRLQIARALVAQPSVLLMDEPFAALDALTRFALEDGLLDVWSQLRPTVVFVTHDLDEALYLADTVIVLQRGPARVERTVPVDLPRPRDQARTRALQEFVAMRYELFETIRAL